MQNDPSLHDHEWDRRLKALPDIPAPPSLVVNVLAEIRKREQRPWHQQPWHCWPFLPKAFALLALVAFLGVTFLAARWLLDSALVEAASARASSWFSTAGTLWTSLAALCRAVALVAKHLGPAFLVPLFAAALFSYLMCVGAGTVAVRCALARRQNSCS